MKKTIDRIKKVVVKSEEPTPYCCYGYDCQSVAFINKVKDGFFILSSLFTWSTTSIRGRFIERGNFHYITEESVENLKKLDYVMASNYYIYKNIIAKDNPCCPLLCTFCNRLCGNRMKENEVSNYLYNRYFIYGGNRIRVYSNEPITIKELKEVKESYIALREKEDA